ncbi:condensation domain-containing protein [Tumebacillus permanentifrigoris]|uniref:Condensation domain-containing protein n=1 Tax=Tumebacillus permanentifrigoris TaxID=378543 RepID=A0A316DC58_9BACL|nr:condensation domain-containing protein [Tumebacillus permanentifrigoris]PWK15791.1 condensation domain-containing protein [Tumebacillus permanentifrigoris]
MNEKLLARLASLSPKQRELLEKQLAKKQAADEGSATIPGVPRDRDGYELSYTQQRMWWIDQVESGSAAYIIPVAVRFRGPFQPQLLERSLNECIKRHEALRTTFQVTSEGQPEQRVTSELNLPIPLVDLSVLAAGERQEEEQRLAFEVCSQPFNLEELPLIRTQLLRIGEHEHLWVVAVHHIVFDGWSTGVFVQEVATLYETLSRGGVPTLPELPVQVIDYAVWQREFLTEERVNKQVEYWKKQLSRPLPVLELPIDHVRPLVRTSKGRHHNLFLQEGLPEQVQEMSRNEEVTLFVTMMAAFQTLLYRYTALEDIIVGFPISGRGPAEIHGVIGAFINSLALRSHVSSDMTFRELLQQVKQRTMEAFEHQDIPFERVLDAVQPERVPGHTPVFQVMFNLNKSVPPIKLSGGLELEYELIDHEAVKFDLSLSIRTGDDTLWCTFEYNADLFEPETIRMLAEQYANVLRAIAQNPEQALAEIDMISAEEVDIVAALGLFDTLE